MFPELEDFEAEGRSLQQLLSGLTPAGWYQPTPFKQWTVWDVIAHLHLSDQWAAASLEGAAPFKTAAAPVFTALKSGTTLADYTRAHFASLPGPAILDAWRMCFADLTRRLAALDPKTRLTWFGPDMGARMFVTARYMETWAHSQDIYDLLGRQREYTDSIRSIATLGVKTFAFTFNNRGLPVPTPEPYVRLIAPSGAVWEWNTPSGTDLVEGKASEFCHVVTQGRNVADTKLRVMGNSARQWMAIAQCFAGLPEDPPAPGARLRAFSA